MQFQYVLQHRDATEAIAHRFPGDPPLPGQSKRAGRTQLLGWAVFLIVAVALYVMLQRAAAPQATTPLLAALSEPDRLDHPVFVSGVILAAIGGAMIVVPLAYLIARKRSARPMFDTPATLEIGDAGVTLRTPDKELVVAWDGIIAVAETRTLVILKTASDLRLLVPRRCIPSPEAAQSLRDELRRRVPPLAAVAMRMGVAA